MRLLAAVLLVLVAAAVPAVAQDQPDGVSVVHSTQEVVEQLTRDLSRRTGREVPVPAVIFASPATRRAILKQRWLQGVPWAADPRARLLLQRLDLLAVDLDLHAVLGALVPEDPGPVSGGEGQRLYLPEEMEVAILPADDPLLEVMGLTTVELRLTAEVARAWAIQRFPDRGLNPDARAAHWSLAEGYARLCGLDRLVRAGGMVPEDLGGALLALDRGAVDTPLDPEAARRLPVALARHLLVGPDEGFRLLVQRWLAGGWPAVEAVLEAPPDGTAGLDPAWNPGKGRRPRLPEPGEGMHRLAQLVLGPRHLRLVLAGCGLPDDKAGALSRGLLADRAALDRGAVDRLVWSLVFRDAQAARALARAWPECLGRRYDAVRPGPTPGQWSWDGGQGEVTLSDATIQVVEDRPAGGPDG
jgi:hypothetical protein